MSIDELLKIIQKTNPTMTKELLIYELSQCRYSMLPKNFGVTHLIPPPDTSLIFRKTILTIFKIRFRFRSNPI